MLIVTKDASAAIHDLLTENGMRSGGLRILVKSGGCAGLQYGMALEQVAKDDDIVLKAEWGSIFIQPDSAEILHGTTLDFSESVAGKGFNFDNPNAVGKCSCGKSFS